MKTTSKIFYTIGRVFNIIGIVVTALGLIAGILVLAFAPQIASSSQDQDLSVFAVRAVGTGLIIGFVIALAVEIVVLCLANYAARSLDNQKRDNAPHIIMLVIGFVSGDIFYLIGGICGLIEENNQPRIE